MSTDSVGIGCSLRVWLARPRTEIVASGDNIRNWAPANYIHLSFRSTTKNVRICVDRVTTLPNDNEGLITFESMSLLCTSQGVPQGVGTRRRGETIAYHQVMMNDSHR